jgi:hypothetical protein
MKIPTQTYWRCSALCGIAAATEPHEVDAFERLALKSEHIEWFNLPTAPPKFSEVHRQPHEVLAR